MSATNNRSAAAPGAPAGTGPNGSSMSTGNTAQHSGDAAQQAASLTTTGEAGFGSTLTPHILVVNDTQEILDLFKEILEEDGFRVSLYSYAFSDISELLEMRPDLVILDFIIGGESHGWTMLQKMKMSRATTNIPVVVCTAALQLARELEGHLRAKNVTVVLKPFDIDDLLDAIHGAFSEGPPRIDTPVSPPARM